MGSRVNFRNLVKKFLYLLYLIVIVVILMEVAYGIVEGEDGFGREKLFTEGARRKSVCYFDIPHYLYRYCL